MPQSRRKVPFSGKQKKQQIVAKRQSKKFFPTSSNYNPDEDDESSDDNQNEAGTEHIQKLNYQSGASGSNNKSNANRYALQFYKETDKQLKHMKEDARKSLKFITNKKQLEMDGTQIFQNYDFPKRPGWTYKMAKEQLERNENRYFTEYVMKLEKEHIDDRKELSYFELNLETWRQLWRVLEISDIILIIVDIRYPTLMFPPSLYDYVTNELGKKMILVLNKIDLASAAEVVAWRQYFLTKFPNISVVLFTSYPGYNLRSITGYPHGLKIRRRKGTMAMAVEGAQQVYKTCKQIVEDSVDLSSWELKIQQESSAIMEKLSVKSGNDGKDIAEDDDDDEESTTAGGVKYDRVHTEIDAAFNFEEHVLYKNGVLTIGCVGFPNVGKSSVLNALMGRKVVSVSKTPGHTKHFQTIFLTNTVRLCDCPGLVFPSQTPRPLQVLLGSYPIAQLRVPMAAVKYLAERIDLVSLLNLKKSMDNLADEWSAMLISEAWAIKRGFLTAKAARPDCSRAANSILRMALEGQISLCFLPPGYSENEEFWSKHEQIPEIEEIQAMGKLKEQPTTTENTAALNSSSTDENESGNDDEDDDDFVPVVKNAFALLNTE